MKNISIKYLFAFAGVLLFTACDTEDELRDDIIANSDNPFAPVVPTGTPGTADFSKYVAVGNSITAGLMDGALYDYGQANSFPNLLAQQFAIAGGGAFVQPDINASRGFNIIFNNLANPTNAPFGRTRLNAVARAPEPLIPGEAITDYTGPAVNNFGVPGARAIDLAVPGYGTLNIFFGRFAENEVTSSVLGDAVAANGTFHTLWIGNNDVLGWISAGGDGPDGEVTTGAELTDASALTSIANFTDAFQATLDALTDGGTPTIVINIPNILASPLLQAVPWNSIELDEATAAAASEGFAGFNGALDGLVGIGAITADAAAVRKVSYAAGANPILAVDNSLDDLGDEFDQLVTNNIITSEQRTALTPFTQARPLTENDFPLILSALSLGTEQVAGDPTTVIGVSVPISDDNIIMADEALTAGTRLATFNAIIASTVAANENAELVDANAKFTEIVTAFVTSGGYEVNGLVLTPDFAPNGIFSTDAVHPNPRGHGIIANEVIKVINETYGASIPEVDISNLSGVILTP